LREVESNLVCSNGIAFSPDDRTMYHTDTGAGRIYAYDYDIAAGDVANRRVLADFVGQTGRPDGCTIDAEGHLWVAQVGGGMIVRLDPKGNRVREIKMPTARPTSVMFGGREFQTLFVTSMKFGLSPEAAAEQPDAGGLFAIDLDVPGLPEPTFAG
jgi:sugar lactone lactonase YvrE